jgi:hypothetical protein
LLTIYALAGAQSQHSIKVLVNGNQVSFPDQSPIMRSNRVLVPLRGVFEELGATVNWDSSKDLVTATRNGQTVELYIGKTTARVGDKELTLDQPATVLNGRAMVPLRFLAESLGATVDWRATDMTVTIKTAT